MYDLVTIQRMNQEAMRDTDYDDWTDDAVDYSDPSLDYVFVEVTALCNEEIIHMTDFRITPKQAGAMFRGIRDAE